MARNPITHVIMFDIVRGRWIRQNEGSNRPMATYTNKSVAKKEARAWAANKARAGQPINLVIMTRDQAIERHTCYNVEK